MQKQNIKVSRSKKSFLKTFVVYPLQLVLLLPFCFLIRLLPLDWVSAFGGFLGRHIGPRLRVSWVARYNLMRAFPEKKTKEIDKIVIDMWDNLGRTFLEYPHLRAIVSKMTDRMQIVHPENMAFLQEKKQAVIMVGGHLGNWEVSSMFGNINDIAIHRVYRYANNPLVEWLFRYYRQKTRGELLPKGMGSMRRIVQLMAQKEMLGLLVDQKMNKGLAVPFFGRKAMTTPSTAHLSLKFNCPILFVRSERLKGAHYRLTVEKPLFFEKSADKENDILNLLTKVNNVYERWIRDDPKQWLWVHKRWPDSKDGAKWLYHRRKEWKKGIMPTDMPSFLNQLCK